MTFDIVFSNPPYNGNIDIKILIEVIDVADELIIVHPATWLMDRKFKKSLYNNFRNQIRDRLVSVDVFNGNPVFNISIFAPLVITHISNIISGNIDVTIFGDNFNVDDVYDVSKFKSDWLTVVKPFKEKLEGITCEHGRLFDTTITKIDKNKFHCQIPTLIGSHDDLNINTQYREDIYTLLMKDSDKNKGIRNEGFYTFEFDTENELDNFMDYVKSKFVRFCLAVYKNAGGINRGETDLIPIVDFNQKWDSSKLYSYFNIDVQTQTYIDNFIQSYYK